MLCFDYRVVTKEEGSKVDQFANYACKPNVLGGGGGLWVWKSMMKKSGIIYLEKVNNRAMFTCFMFGKYILAQPCTSFSEGWIVF